MFIVITLFLLLATAISLVVLRFSRPDFSYAWPLALAGSFLAWSSTFLWQIQLPVRLVLFSYSFKDVFNYSLILLVDEFNYPYAIGVTSLALAVILASVVQASNINPIDWARIILISILGLLAVLAENPLTLVIAWSLIDVAGLITTLYSVDDPRLSERAVFAYSARTIGMGFVLWAGILSSSNEEYLAQSILPARIGFLLILGIMLRTGSMLFHFPSSKDSPIRHGYDTTFLLVFTASNLVLLSRPILNFNNPLASTLIIIGIAITGLLANYYWLRSSGDQTSQPLWIIGLVSLAIVASIQSNPIGSTAWGSSCLFIGGLLFLYSARKKWLTLILILGAFCLSALPFSLTATGWIDNSINSWLPMIILLPLQALLIAGYIRATVHDGGVSLDNQPSWVKVFYPMGFISLVLTGLLLGFFGWAGAGQIGAWIPALISVIISILLLIIIVRIPMTAQLDKRNLYIYPNSFVDFISSIIGGVFSEIRRTMELLSSTLEGDGGFLWTILFLIVFISVLRGFIR